MAPATPDAYADHVKSRTGADLSALYKHTQGVVQWSPNGEYVAVVKENRLSIRQRDSFQILQVYSCSDIVHHVEWSPDSNFVLAAMYKRGFLQVFSRVDNSWNCKINEGVTGIVNAFWAPDSMHAITVADFQLHMTVWSLQTRKSYVIRRPKLKTGGVAFSPGGHFMVVAEREDCKDSIGVYDTQKWELVRHFVVDTYDLSEVGWDPSQAAIFIRESSLEYNILFYSADGRKLGSYQAYRNALGIKTVSWSKTGQLLAVGSYDQKIRIINNLTWKPIAELDHEKACPPETKMIGYEEYLEDSVTDEQVPSFANNKENSFGGSAQNKAVAKKIRKRVDGISFLTHKSIPRMPVIIPDPTMSSNVRHGVGIVSWSHDSKFLASRNDSMPHTLWIWDAELMQVRAVIVCLDAIRSMRWCPTRGRIAFCTGNSRVYLWSVEGTSWVDVPSDGLSVMGLRWNPDGKSIILLGKEELCCAYL